MMYSEFYERTKTEVSYEEYHFIEESYYEFDGNKDEFCKAWLKDKKSGKWAVEMRLRKAIEDQKKEYEAKLAEKEEDLEFYRGFTDQLRTRAEAAEKKVERAKEYIDHFKFRLDTFKDEMM